MSFSTSHLTSKISEEKCERIEPRGRVGMGCDVVFVWEGGRWPTHDGPTMLSGNSPQNIAAMTKISLPKKSSPSKRHDESNELLEDRQIEKK